MFQILKYKKILQESQYMFLGGVSFLFVFFIFLYNKLI